MIELQKIHEFAYRWYCDLEWNADEPIDEMIADCEAIGLEYDSSIDYQAIFFSLFNITDPIVIAKAVYMKLLAYRDGEQEEKIISWLKKVLCELVLLSDPKLSVFESKIKKIKIYSHVGFYDYCSSSHDIESQSVTLLDTGKAYVYQRGVPLVGPPIYKSMKVCKLDSGAFDSISIALKKHLERAYLQNANDGGFFDLEIENIDGIKTVWSGVMCSEHCGISAIIKEALGLRYLMLLDGCANWDVVDGAKLEYWYTDKEYKESFSIDRNKKELRITRNIDSKRIEDISISDSVDVGNALDFLSTIPDPPGLIPEPLTIVNSKCISSTWTRHYKIDLLKQDGRTEAVEGYFEKNDIFNEWKTFVEKVTKLFPVLKSFEIFNSSIINSESCNDGQVLLCKVAFPESSKLYSYLTDDEMLLHGDQVIVPVGNEGTTAVATIVDKQILDRKDVPYPVDKIKKIIGLFKRYNS